MKFKINQEVTYLGDKGIITNCTYSDYYQKWFYDIKVKRINGFVKVVMVIESDIFGME